MQVVIKINRSLYTRQTNDMARELATSYNELLHQAKEVEHSSAIETAIKYYKKAIRLEPLEPFSYNRLMIIYRKEKNYTAELIPSTGE